MAYFLCLLVCSFVSHGHVLTVEIIFANMFLACVVEFSLPMKRHAKITYTDESLLKDQEEMGALSCSARICEAPSLLILSLLPKLESFQVCPRRNGVGKIEGS